MKFMTNVRVEGCSLVLDILCQEEPLKARIYYPNIKAASKESWLSFYVSFEQNTYKVLDLGPQGKIVTASGFTTFIGPTQEGITEAMEISMPNYEIEAIMEKRIMRFFMDKEAQS